MRSDVETMTSAEKEPGETLEDPARLRALRDAQLLDTPPEEAFDRLTDLARALMRAPVALLSLVEKDRQFFKSQQGLPEPWAGARQTPLSHSFCQHVVTRREALVINDARRTPLVAGNAAIRDLDVIAYLGVPVVDPGGHVLGSLCVIDSVPRDWSESDVTALIRLSGTVMSEIALRQALREKVEAEAELRASEARNRLLLRELSHRVNNALAIVQSMVRQSLRSADTLQGAAAAIEGRLGALGRAHALLSHESKPLTGMRELLEASTAPFRRSANSFRFEGEDVTLPSRLALMFSLALHELATNASKYGGLTAPDGCVHIGWQVSDPGTPRLVLNWTEQGGPPVERPRKNGFGSQLIRRVAQAQNADVSLDFARAGVRCTISVPLSERPVVVVAGVPG